MLKSPIYVRADAPSEEQRTKDAEFTLYRRACWPKPTLDVRIPLDRISDSLSSRIGALYWWR
jgi:hypothetical protein